MLKRKKVANCSSQMRWKKKQTLRLYLSEEQKNDVILCTIMLYTKIN